MEPFDSYAFLPTPPRAGRQGRRNMCPVWWRTSDESSYSISGLDERPDDESSIRDGTMQKMIQQQHSGQFEASAPLVLPDKTAHDPAKCANRLRRRPAVISLSKQYLESGECSPLEYHEAGIVQGQTIHSAVATQDGQYKTSNRASRHSSPSAGMNQLGEVKISPGSQSLSAQTAAASNVVGVCEDTGYSAGKQSGHKVDYTIESGAEDTLSRSSITSEDTESIRGFGAVRAKIGRVQHSETSQLSPQQAEFLNVHSSSVLHGSLQLSSGRRLSSTHDHTQEQDKPGLIQSFRARFDNKFSAPANDRHQNRRQAAMRVETTPRRAWSSHGDDLVKIAASCHWGDQSDPKRWLLDADKMLSQQAVSSPHTVQHNRRRPLHQQPPVVPRSPGARPHRGAFMLGQAQAVKISKPGEPRLVKLATKKSRAFNIDILSSEEADLMASAGAVARSSRRSGGWTDDKSRQGKSSDIGTTADTALPKKGRRQSRIPRAIPRPKEDAARSSKQPVGEDSSNDNQDVRFHRLVRQLESHGPRSSRRGRDPAVRETSPMSRQQGAASEKQSEMPIIHGQALMRGDWSSGLDHKQGYLGLDDPSQRASSIDDGPVRFRELVQRLKTRVPESTLPSRSPAKAKLQPRDSGCPSLISDDGREASDSPGDMAYEYARAQMFEGPHTISGWETDEDTSTLAPHEAPSKSSFALFSISTDEDEGMSGSDTSENLADENTSNGDDNGCGQWYREVESVTSPPFSQYGNLPSSLRERLRGGRATGRQPNELTLNAQHAILRWLLVTTDAPGTEGMHDESAKWWQLLDLNPDAYQLRYGDEARAEILRTLRLLSGANEPRTA